MRSEPGSYLVLGHATHEGQPAVARATETVYNRSVATDLRLRSREEIMRFFDGFELVDTGMVYVRSVAARLARRTCRAIPAGSSAWSQSDESPDAPPRGQTWPMVGSQGQLGHDRPVVRDRRSGRAHLAHRIRGDSGRQHVVELHHGRCEG